MTGIQDDLSVLREWAAESRQMREVVARVEAEIARIDRIASSHISRADRREGMVVAYDYEGEYVGCIGAHTWRWLLDSGVTEAEIARLEQERDSWIRSAELAVQTWEAREQKQHDRAEAAEAEIARLRDVLRDLVTLVRIGFLVSVNDELVTADNVNGPKMRQLLFTILQAEDSETTARALLAEDGAGGTHGPDGFIPDLVDNPDLVDGAA